MDSSNGMFIRYTTIGQYGDRTQEEGIFLSAYKLLDEQSLPPSQQQELRDRLLWFQIHIRPVELDFEDGRKNALCWYKPEATEALERTLQLAVFLRGQGFMIGVNHMQDPGFIVYNDEHQIAAFQCSSWQFLVYHAKDAVGSFWQWMMSSLTECCFGH